MGDLPNPRVVVRLRLAQWHVGCIYGLLGSQIHSGALNRIDRSGSVDRSIGRSPTSPEGFPNPRVDVPPIVSRVARRIPESSLCCAPSAGVVACRLHLGPVENQVQRGLSNRINGTIVRLVDFARRRETCRNLACNVLATLWPVADPFPAAMCPLCCPIGRSVGQSVDRAIGQLCSLG